MTVAECLAGYEPVSAAVVERWGRERLRLYGYDPDELVGEAKPRSRLTLWLGGLLDREEFMREESRQRRRREVLERALKETRAWLAEGRL